MNTLEFNELPDKEYLKSILKYNPDNGHFTWKISRGRVKPGSRAGQKQSRGYRCIRVDGKLYYEQRLAWIMSNNKIQDGQVVHHKNDIRDDNRLLNLEATTQSDNLLRRPKQAKYARKQRNKYISQFTLHNIKHYQGMFDTEEEATLASIVKRNELLSSC
jgi:hypothetical protein